MSDDLEFDVRSTEGEGPTPEFVANLRARLAHEMAAMTTAVDDEPTQVLELRPDEGKHAMTKTRWMLAAGAAAAIALIVGVFALSGDSADDGVKTVDTPEEQTTTTPGQTTTTRAGPTTTTPDEAAISFAPDATSLTEAGVALAPGFHRVDAFGTPFAFTTAILRSVFVNRNGAFAMGHQDSQAAGDRDIVFMRLSALWDPDPANSQLADSAAGWPADDFAGWLDNLGDVAVVSNREETTLGGLDALRVDLVAGADSVGFGRNHSDAVLLSPGSTHRIWVVSQGDEAPLAVTVGILDDADSDWLVTAEGILETLEFGEITPNPIVVVPAGPAELSFLGGIRVELEGETTLVQHPSGYGKILLENSPADTEFITNLLDIDGNTVETADQVVALVSDGGSEVSELASTTVGGIEARVFEIAGSPSVSVLKRHPADEGGWRAPPRGQLWLVEHPERGLLMLNAQVDLEVDRFFPPVVAQAEQVVGSLEFIELR